MASSFFANRSFHAEREPEPRTLYDVVDAKQVVATLHESLTACLTVAAARDGVELSTEQIARFVGEMSRNAAQTILLMEISK